MDQYKSEGQQDKPVQAVKASDESKQIRSVESTVKQLQDNIGIQQQEIFRLKRELSRLKSLVDDVIIMVKNRG